VIAHGLTIIVNELNKHLVGTYGSIAPQAALGNVAEGFSSGNGGLPRDLLYLLVVNIKEEKALKNVPTYVRNTALRLTYENPPAFLNFQILAVATHVNYVNALSVLSRTIRFFQFRNTFTQDNVDPASIATNQPTHPLDRLESFKLIFDLYSPSMEEVNHLWGTLGGKQYPFVLYMLRMLDLKFRAVQSEVGLITEVISDFYHKNPAAT